MMKPYLFLLVVSPLVKSLPVNWLEIDLTGFSCSESELYEMIEESSQCFAKADQKTDLARKSKDKALLAKAYCDAETEQISCWKRNGPRCFNASRVANIQYSFMSKHFYTLHYIDDISSYIPRWCPAMSSVADENLYVMYITGANKCSYKTVANHFFDMRVCEFFTGSDLETSLALAKAFPKAGNKLARKAFCEIRDTWVTQCRPKFVNCLATTGQYEVAATHIGIFVGWEARIQGIEGFKDFKFDKTCPKIVDPVFN